MTKRKRSRTFCDCQKFEIDIIRLKKNAKRIGRVLKKHGPRLGRQGKEVKSNVTDNESANMMTSHGTIQGYDGQALF
jgi:hypothetical protein